MDTAEAHARAHLPLRGRPPVSSGLDRDELDSKACDAAKVRLVPVSDKHAETEVHCRRCNRQVVRRDELTTAAQLCEQVSPMLGDLLPELDDWHPSNEGSDAPASSRSSRRAPSQPCPDEQLAAHDRWHDRNLVFDSRQKPLPFGARPFGSDNRARVDYEPHGSSRGRSAAQTRSRSSANAASGSPTEPQAANASRMVVGEPSGTGAKRATDLHCALRETSRLGSGRGRERLQACA